MDVGERFGRQGCLCDGLEVMQAEYVFEWRADRCKCCRCRFVQQSGAVVLVCEAAYVIFCRKGFTNQRRGVDLVVGSSGVSAGIFV